MQFPPARGSGVYRIRAWAHHLVNLGYDVTVLCTNREYWERMSGSLDDELASRTDPRIKIVEIEFPHEHLINDVRQMSWLHANFPRAFLLTHKLIQTRGFPEAYAPMIPVYLKHALAVHRRHRVDMVLASGNPYSLYAVAWAFHKITRRPYVVDYHDPWTLDVLTEEDKFPRDHPSHTWERRIVKDAARVITVNEPLCEWYRERYPEAADRVRKVELGLALDVLTEPTFEPVGDRPLRFGFLGTVRHDLPIEEFLEAWDIARTEPVMRDATMNFYGYLGFFSRHEGVLGNRLAEGAASGVAYHGPVSQTRIMETFSSLDVLVLLLPSSKYMTAGKGFDYMATGRPIVGVFHPRNQTTELLASYDLYEGTTDVEPHAIAKAILGAAYKAKAETYEDFERNRGIGLSHTWDAAMAPVSAEFEEIMS
jgi:glycosyltransferase involved in cell wall biosynthesis